MNTWWGSFWDMGEAASMIVTERSETEKFALMKQVMVLRFDWETGYYYDAGKRFANIWKILIGEPEWIDFEAEPYFEEEAFEGSDEPERYPLADYYSAYLGETYGVDVYDQV